MRRCSGVDSAEDQTTGFAYDPATSTATWTFAQPLPKDKLLLHVTNFVTDADGDRLDGEWPTASADFPSGNGTPDGVFQFRVNTLPADADRSGRVNSLDKGRVKAREGRSTTNPGEPGTATYTPYDDLDASGVITGTPGGLPSSKASLAGF